ncbi:hypothetical protein Y1Q_0000118 [Alligator mississippiensis]|uniref:Uncharacterized protein n=1 Tax=Alligator mississippiensis TaxID=8496 RepID=A0A151NQQ1_ALLMI|nr:hypothetical protein Y1Q_0000118 [Alligator mississippiensis]
MQLVGQERTQAHTAWIQGTQRITGRGQSTRATQAPIQEDKPHGRPPPLTSVDLHVGTRAGWQMQNLSSLETPR